MSKRQTGEKATPEKRGAVCFRAVQLSKLLGGRPSHFREAEAEESDRFKSYFDRLEYMQGGSPAAFRSVVPVGIVSLLFFLSVCLSHTHIQAQSIHYHVCISALFNTVIASSLVCLCLPPSPLQVSTYWTQAGLESGCGTERQLTVD